MKLKSIIIPILLASMILSSIPLSSGLEPWVNDNFNYRVPVTVDAGAFERLNCPINTTIDFASYTQLQVDKSSIRLCTQNGTEVASQLQWLTATNCTIYFRVTIPANTQATYYIYFSAGKTMAAPTYTSDLSATTISQTITIENAKYKIQWTTNTDAKGIFIKNYSTTSNLNKVISDQEHSLFYVYLEPHNLFHIRYPTSTTQTNQTTTIAKLVTSGPEVTVMNLYQYSWSDATKNMTLYFYPAQNYFIVEERAEYEDYSGDGYLALQWCILMDCGTAPTSYADTQGRYYTAENPNNYGLGLVWLQKDPHLTWKSFSDGKLTFDLPTWASYYDEIQYSRYAIVLDGANIRDTTQNVYNWLTNPPTATVSQTAETPTAALQVSAPSTLTLAPNTNNPLTLTLQNTGNIAAQNIHLSAAGIPVSWVTFSEDYFTIDANAQKTITLTINPASASEGEYNLTISASTPTLPAQNVNVTLNVSNQATIPPVTPTPNASTPTPTAQDKSNTQMTIDNGPWLYVAAVTAIAVVAIVIVMMLKRKNK